MKECNREDYRAYGATSGATMAPARDVAPTQLIGRQPILDTSRDVYGYEMLFRSGQENVFSGDADDATRDVIDHCLLLMPTSGRESSFVNCTRNALISGIVTLLPPASTVIEILEDIDPDTELIGVCRDLRKKGYRFALDDFAPEESKRRFLEIADFIKIDFLASNFATRQAIYAMATGKRAVFIAEKIETEEDLQVARAEGCELFQGYYFSKPVIISTREIPQNHAVHLRLLAELTRAPADISEIESLVLSDASLCYRLLRLVNSPLYALRSTVASIRSALMVGDDEFRKMVTVALAGLAGKRHSRAVVQMVLERAKFCELLAPLMNESAPRLYLLGMLSVIDVILEIPMAQIMDSLPVDREIRPALLGDKHTLSIALDLVHYHETGDLGVLASHQDEVGLTEQASSTIYIKAVQWANTVNHAVCA
jgi:c-di-GMP-related signal transduction protein